MLIGFGGEFRLGLEIPAQFNCPTPTQAMPNPQPVQTAPAVQFNAPVVDMGIALRLAI